MAQTATSRPPECLELGTATVRRHRLDDAAALAEAIAASLDHLRPWMPWASTTTATVEAQHRRLTEVLPHWDHDVEYVYVLVEPGGTAVWGCVGLHRRIGPGGIEIGYWLRPDRTGRGLMTAAVRALTEVALALPDVDRVEIHCDAANGPSRRIPERLGFRLVRERRRPAEAPGESGRQVEWVLDDPADLAPPVGSSALATDGAAAAPPARRG
jgi:RimJ/RimL family protein N-acetyltransferase